MSDGRLVWITDEHRDALQQRIRLVGRGYPTDDANAVEAIVAAWDAAPSDATQAVVDAMYDEYGECVDDAPGAVLAALRGDADA